MRQIQQTIKKSDCNSEAKIICLDYITAWPSGKAADSNSAERGFESLRRSHIRQLQQLVNKKLTVNQ